jgi:hypothetical protein
MKGEVMRIRGIIEKCSRALVLVLVLMVAVPPGTFGQQAGQPVFKQEELDQILAPIALYPDSLLAQILMASTYPLEVVQADRWAKQNTTLKGDALTAALEKRRSWATPSSHNERTSWTLSRRCGRRPWRRATLRPRRSSR